MNYDAFISHATEDKTEVARPLAAQLGEAGLRIWLDECELTVGDSLRREIDKGLSKSRFGIVILSPAFFSKEWPQKELDALVAREDGKQKVILPVWHGLSKKDVASYAPLLADKLAVSTANGLQHVAQQLIRAISKSAAETASTALHDAEEMDEVISGNPGAGSHTTENHPLRFFYYISRQKIDMLSGQLGTSVPTGSDIVAKTVALLGILKKNNYLTSLSDIENLEESKYIEDKSEWHHGLYGFQATGQEIVSYFLWKVVDSTLFLLVGCPNNILGDKVVVSGSYVPGTSGALLHVLDFVRSTLSTDEPTAVSIGPLPFYGQYGEGARNTHSLAANVVELADEGIQIAPTLQVKSEGRFGRRDEDASQSSRQPGRFRDGIAGFCVEHLKHLPLARIETVFKIYSVFREEHTGTDDSRFTATILASPLYVAID